MYTISVQAKMMEATQMTQNWMSHQHAKQQTLSSPGSSSSNAGNNEPNSQISGKQYLTHF